MIMPMILFPVPKVMKLLSAAKKKIWFMNNLRDKLEYKLGKSNVDPYLLFMIK